MNENPTDTGALMAYGLYIARMPPFFPRPTARPDTLAFPVYSEEAANVIAKALELLAEKRKNLMLGNIQLKKPQALSTTDKGIKIPTLSVRFLSPLPPLIFFLMHITSCLTGGYYNAKPEL